MFKDFFKTKKGYFLAVVLFLTGSAGAYAQNCSSFEITNPLENRPQQYTIQGVEVEGVSSVEPSFVIGQTGLEEGTQITWPGSDLANAIRQLNRLGLFTDVCISRTRLEGNNVWLMISLQEQPRLENYEIRGVKRSQRNDLRERITMVSGFSVNESAKAQAVNTIKRFYREKGNWFTEVAVTQSEPDSVTNRVTVYFDIDPGKRLEVKDISFEGNDSFSERTLKKQLKPIKEDRWWSIITKKDFTEEEFEEGKENLRQFYLERGYLDFRILEDSVFTYIYTKDLPGVGIHLEISEGTQYKVRNITWEGNEVFTDAELSGVLGFEKGDLFNQRKFAENMGPGPDRQDILSLYHNNGYLFSNFSPNINRVAEDSVDIRITIREDEQAEIREVTFTGNSKTHDDVVRRSLRTVPGQIYNRELLIRTVRELGQLGFFRPESINPGVYPNPEDYTVDIGYELNESQSTDNFELSGGFGGRGIGLILSARVNFNNFSLQRALRGEGWDPIPSGDGQRLSFGVQITGSGYKSYNVGFQEPWLGGKPTALGVNMSYDLIKFRNSDARNELFSSSVTLGRQLDWPDDYFRQQSVLSYQLYDVSGGTGFLAEGTSSILSLTQIIERNSVDNRISPTMGSQLRFSAEFAPPLPGFSQFYKLKSSYQNHTPVVGDLVMTNTVEYGYVGYLGSRQRSEFQRFILGGTQMQQRQSFLQDNIELRGFPGGRQGSISPLENGEQVGGRLYSKYSVEMRLKVVEEEQIQVIPYTFIDAGNAYLDFQDFAPFDVKRATGVGVRLYLPILGLVDLSYGYRLDGIHGTGVNAGEWEFLFNIGAPF